MNIRDVIEMDLKSSIKSGDKNIRDVLRMLISDIKNIEIEKKSDLIDEDVLAVIKKKCKEKKGFNQTIYRWR